jgi:hypothetical protein
VLLDVAAACGPRASPEFHASPALLAVGLQMRDPGLRFAYSHAGFVVFDSLGGNEREHDYEQPKRGLCSVHLQQATGERPRLAICLCCSTLLWVLRVEPVLRRTFEARATEARIPLNLSFGPTAR